MILTFLQVTVNNGIRIISKLIIYQRFPTCTVCWSSHLSFTDLYFLFAVAFRSSNGRLRECDNSNHSLSFLSAFWLSSLFMGDLPSPKSLFHIYILNHDLQAVTGFGFYFPNQLRFFPPLLFYTYFVVGFSVP